MTSFLGVLPILDGVPTTFTNQGGGLRGLIIGNESGLTVVIAMDGTSHSKSLYPGTVDFFPIDGAFSGTVKVKPTAMLSNTPQWPSSFLQFDAVGVNEQVNTGVYPLTLPRLTNVGNSIPVSTSTSGITNEGNAINTEVIDIGPLGNIRMIDIFNDHFLWSVVQAGIAHQVLKGNTAGNPLQIGQAGDITEILGKLAVDQDTNITSIAVHVVGGTSGTSDLYQPLQGTLKIVIVSCVNFQPSVTMNMSLPVAFTRGLFYLAGDTPNFQFLKTTVAQTVNIITAVGNPGTNTGFFTGQKYSFGECPSAVDAFSWTSAGVSHAGFVIMVGV